MNNNTCGLLLTSNQAQHTKVRYYYSNMYVMCNFCFQPSLCLIRAKDLVFIREKKNNTRTSRWVAEARRGSPISHAIRSIFFLTFIVVFSKQVQQCDQNQHKFQLLQLEISQRGQLQFTGRNSFCVPRDILYSSISFCNFSEIQVAWINKRPFDKIGRVGGKDNPMSRQPNKRK